MLVSDSKGRRAPILIKSVPERVPIAGLSPLLLHSTTVGNPMKEKGLC